MIRVADIKRAVADEFGIPLDELNGFSRRYDYSHPRQLGMALSAVATGHSQARIGFFFDRDPTTVIFARKAVRRRLRSDAEFRDHARNVLKALRS